MKRKVLLFMAIGGAATALNFGPAAAESPTLAPPDSEVCAAPIDPPSMPPSTPTTTTTAPPPTTTEPPATTTEPPTTTDAALDTTTFSPVGLRTVRSLVDANPVDKEYYIAGYISGAGRQATFTYTTRGEVCKFGKIDVDATLGKSRDGKTNIDLLFLRIPKDPKLTGLVCAPICQDQWSREPPARDK